MEDRNQMIWVGGEEKDFKKIKQSLWKEGV